MKKRFLILAFTGFVFCVFSQNQDSSNINIFQDSRIDTLVKAHIMLNDYYLTNPDNDGITGFRINIFFDSGNRSKSMAEEVSEDFVKLYPETNTYISFKAPYYYVRVGNFRTRIEAEAFYNKINNKYPNAWIIKDKINFPKLKNINNQQNQEL